MKCVYIWLNSRRGIFITPNESLSARFPPRFSPQGPKGELAMDYQPEVTIKVEDGVLTVSPNNVSATPVPSDLRAPAPRRSRGAPTPHRTSFVRCASPGFANALRREVWGASLV